MENRRHQLLPYKTPADRMQCPQCGGKKTFAPYMDTVTNSIIDESCGKCNRAESCGYHLPPRGFFADNQHRKPQHSPKRARWGGLPVPQTPQKRTVYIPAGIVQGCQRREARAGNNWWLYLAAKFGADNADKAFDAYHLGTSNAYGGGATVFPLLDGEGYAAAQVIKVVAATGKTVRFGSDKRAQTWLHSVMLKNGCTDAWLAAYARDAHRVPFCFGLHLALAEPEKVVCIVESAKTAVFQSIIMPEFIWLAVCAKDFLTPARLAALKNHTLVLVPDGGAGETDWTRKAGELARQGFDVDVSLLGLPDGDDIADLDFDVRATQPPAEAAFEAEAAQPPAEAAQPPQTPQGDTQPAAHTIAPIDWTQAGDAPPVPFDRSRICGVTRTVTRQDIEELFAVGVPFPDTDIAVHAQAHGLTFEDVIGHFTCLGRHTATEDGKPHWFYELAALAKMADIGIPISAKKAGGNHSGSIAPVVAPVAPVTMPALTVRRHLHGETPEAVAGRAEIIARLAAQTPDGKKTHAATRTTPRPKTRPQRTG